MPTDEQNRLREYDREMFRSSFVSLFSAIVQHRKNEEGLTFSKVADRLGINKSAVSRWFNKAPNWRLNTISDLANVLDVDLVIEARDRTTGVIYTPAGVRDSDVLESASIPGARVVEFSIDTNDHLEESEGMPRAMAETAPYSERAP